DRRGLWLLLGAPAQSAARPTAPCNSWLYVAENALCLPDSARKWNGRTPRTIPDEIRSSRPVMAGGVSGGRRTRLRQLPLSCMDSVFAQDAADDDRQAAKCRESGGVRAEANLQSAIDRPAGIEHVYRTNVSGDNGPTVRILP